MTATQTKQEFIAFLKDTLIPDLIESGLVETAADFNRAIGFMETPTRTKRPLYREIAALVQALKYCKEDANREWEEKHTERLIELTGDWLPHGSGFDSGSKLSIEDCKPGKLVFETGYHHMNDAGYYDGWTEHTVVITPSFDGIDIRVTGRDRNSIKDYIHEMFHTALMTEIEIS